MKKFVLVISVLMVFILSSCSMYYDYDKVDKYGYGYSSKLEKAFISVVEYCIGDDNNIILPESYNGYPVKELGGYTGRGYPCPFYIDILDLDEMYETQNAVIIYAYMDEVNEGIEDGKNYEYYDIKLNVTLPPLLEEISNSRANAVYILESLDGEYLETPVVYRVLFNFTIDENNKYFYTKDGKLYYKKNNQMVDDFLYE